MTPELVARKLYAFARQAGARRPDDAQSLVTRLWTMHAAGQLDWSIEARIVRYGRLWMMSARRDERRARERFDPLEWEPPAPEPETRPTLPDGDELPEPFRTIWRAWAGGESNAAMVEATGMSRRGLRSRLQDLRDYYIACHRADEEGLPRPVWSRRAYRSKGGA